jgi:signal transduction histidine kinase/ActR/RegA family two-component response regulator
MMGWFERLPIHRKLVVVALGVTGASLIVTLFGLGVIDLWRFRVAAEADTVALARVMAENMSASVMFDDFKNAQDTLATIRDRDVVRRACVYLPSRELFAGYSRSPDLQCPPRLTFVRTYNIVSESAQVQRNEHDVGTVYIERDLRDIGARIVLTLVTGTTMLILAAALAFGLSHRLNRAISEPIVHLADAARGVGRDPAFEMPVIEAAPDEVGELVKAFGEMVARIRQASTDLLETNASLRREIDERRRVEAERELLLIRERQASRLKDEFLAAVSHELRTPLNAIVGWIQILAAQRPDEETLAKAVASLSRNAQAQTRVIEDLIDVSRAVTGKLHLKLEALDLGDVVDAAVEVIRPMARARKVTLTVHTPADPCIAHGDPDRLQQIVWNLLSNAVKFTPAGGTVTVDLALTDGQYVLSVSDTGVGIAPEFLPRVFERFLQADGSMTRQFGGLGLGLAIVKDLTELHGGTVAVSSEGIGRGATFTIRLPPYDPVAPLVPLEPPEPLPALDGIHVLVVDDNEDALDVLRAALETAGAQVSVAASGPEAIGLWQRDGCDVLLCDLAMPGMNGFEVLQRIRALEHGRAATPAIAISAYASREYVVQTERAGFRDHIAKPYHPGSVIRRVAAAARSAAGAGGSHGAAPHV